MGWGNAIGALVGGVATVLAAPVVLCGAEVRRRYSIEGIATACAVARSVGSLDELMRTKEGRKAWAKFVDLTCEMVQQVGTEKTVKFYFGLPTS